MEDSKQWKDALESYKKSKKRYKVKQVNTPTVVTQKPHKTKKKKKKYSPKPKAKKQEPTILQKEYAENRKQLMYLNRRQKELKKLMDERGINTMVRWEYYDKNITLYVLKLEDDCWYIGSTRNIEKRFKEHNKGKGSNWTRAHKPIEIYETRETGTNHDSTAGKLEDQLTIEYALKYCAQRVRGGGYVQREPRWGPVVEEAEAICSHT